MPRSEGYVDSNFLKKTADLLRQVKLRTYELMQVGAGDHVLDVGCGPGMDTIPLAERVGRTGKVVGVDLDEEMLVVADKHAREARVGDRVTHRQGDVTALPFAADTFDACRAERMFQSLPSSVDPQHALADIARVTKRGGRVVIADADWGSASLDTDDVDLERRLARFFAERLRPNGFAGRQLYRLFRRQGFADITVEIFPLYQTRYAQTHYGEWLQREAVAEGVITPAEAQRWHASLLATDTEGVFFSSGNMILVAGRKP